MTGSPARKPSPSLTQITISVSFLCMMLCSLNAWGSSGVVAAVEKKYVVTEVSVDHDQITKDGTTMSLKCAGIYSLPTNQMLTTPDNAVAGRCEKIHFRICSELGA
jgi:hypothetical protein